MTVVKRVMVTNLGLSDEVFRRQVIRMFREQLARIGVPVRRIRFARAPQPKYGKRGPVSRWENYYIEFISD